MQTADSSPKSARQTVVGPPDAAESGHDMPPLPYGFSALAPVISERTLRVHYGKHYKGYVDELNRLVVGTEFVGARLEDIVRATANTTGRERLYNNAAQAWNHAFYWRCLRSNGGGDVPRSLQPLVNASFGDTAALKSQWLDAATTQFGSGWAWLAYDGRKLQIIKTGNAGCVLTMGLTPVLVLDVWEHAYYLDYENRRAAHVEAVVEKLINWQFAEANIAPGVWR